MSDDATQQWERQPKEPTRWFERFQLYLYAGPSRSVHQIYLDERLTRAEAKNAKRKVKQPIEDLSPRVGLPASWTKAARDWKWRERASAWDDDQRKVRSQLFSERQQEILSSGFAARYMRIYELNRLAELLQAEIYTQDKRWLPDVKQIGSGEDAERVDIVRFNSSVIEQYRGALEDLAHEMGERERGVKLKGTITHVDVTSDDMAKARQAAQEWEQTNFGNE